MTWNTLAFHIWGCTPDHELTRIRSCSRPSNLLIRARKKESHEVRSSPSTKLQLSGVTFDRSFVHRRHKTSTRRSGGAYVEYFLRSSTT
ncbi:hypothetical protein HYDPIDRAFT_109796 [Hydnomerulius pinastri MD-312]|nr:hypothetical protein HYDPIDRAFT_109796 [Hydnomerulius pinastri MD-312]